MVGLALFKEFLFICLFLAALGVCCCERAFSSCGKSRSYSLVGHAGFSLQKVASCCRTWASVVDWIDLLAVQGALKSLPQHHNSKLSILWCSAFFMVQLSHLYMTTGKTIALTIQTFVGKVISFPFNMLSRFVIGFPSRRSKHFLISWLQLPSTVILEPKKIKSVTTFTVSPSICQEVMGPDVIILVFWMLKSQPFHSPLASSSRGSLVSCCSLPLE